MRMTTLMTGLLATSLLAGCGGSTPTSPGGNPMPGSGGDGGDGGGGGAPNPATAAVTVGNVFFRSSNGTVNPAVDRIAVGGTVTWTWANNGSVQHNIQSQGSPSFTSSPLQSASGSTYQVTFSTAGVYHYDCLVHGSSMSGTVIVE